MAVVGGSGDAQQRDGGDGDGGSTTCQFNGEDGNHSTDGRKAGLWMMVVVKRAGQQQTVRYNIQSWVAAEAVNGGMMAMEMVITAMTKPFLSVWCRWWRMGGPSCGT